MFLFHNYDFYAWLVYYSIWRHNSYFSKLGYWTDVGKTETIREGPEVQSGTWNSRGRDCFGDGQKQDTSIA